MFNANFVKAFLFWFIIIAAGWWYFGIYQPSHPPKPSATEIAERNKYEAEKAYRKAHPEENETIAILAAKYNVDIKAVQTIILSFGKSYKEKNKQLFISNLSKNTGISEQTIASILIDDSYLTSDCSQPESE
jgi:hypothetical protein